MFPSLRLYSPEQHPLQPPDIAQSADKRLRLGPVGLSSTPPAEDTDTARSYRLTAQAAETSTVLAVVPTIRAVSQIPAAFCGCWWAVYGCCWRLVRHLVVLRLRRVLLKSYRGRNFAAIQLRGAADGARLWSRRVMTVTCKVGPLWAKVVFFVPVWFFLSHFVPFCPTLCSFVLFCAVLVFLVGCSIFLQLGAILRATSCGTWWFCGCGEFC
jgi:hypothetical protein